jgi:glutamate formiminotransferase
MPTGLLECVINVSEGREPTRIVALSNRGGRHVLDVHSDPDHHRSVLTLAGPGPEVMGRAREVARATVSLVDLRIHSGAHPRRGALDVVPFVALQGWPVENGDLTEAVGARDEFAKWAGSELQLPCFLYGPERTLPEVRRRAWHDLLPDYGPPGPHPTAGAAAVGARPVLVAYNLWLVEPDLEAARRVAAELRHSQLRTLGIRVGTEVQVSCNLIDPWRVGPGVVFDAVASRVAVARAELVGLVPQTVLAAEPSSRWKELGLDPSATIEARLEKAGLDGGSFRTHV